MNKELLTKLKSIGLTNVNYNTTKNPSRKGCYKPLTKGIEGGGTGPMTCTSAHKELDRKAEDKLISVMRDGGYLLVGERSEYGFTLSDGTEKIRCCWRRYGTYDRTYDYDPSYQTNWITLSKIK
jgi:hypothetical protein